MHLYDITPHGTSLSGCFARIHEPRRYPTLHPLLHFSDTHGRLCEYRWDPHAQAWLPTKENFPTISPLAARRYLLRWLEGECAFTKYTIERAEEGAA